MQNFLEQIGRKKNPKPSAAYEDAAFFGSEDDF